MENTEKKALVVKHAKLIAALAAGNNTVREELAAIEAKLELSAPEIAQLAVTEYLRDY